MPTVFHGGGSPHGKRPGCNERARSAGCAQNARCRRIRLPKPGACWIRRRLWPWLLGCKIRTCALWRAKNLRPHDNSRGKKFGGKGGPIGLDLDFCRELKRGARDPNPLITAPVDQKTRTGGHLKLMLLGGYLLAAYGFTGKNHSRQITQRLHNYNSAI